MPPNSFMSLVTRPRMYGYGIISTLAALYAVGLASERTSNFYAAVVFLGRSNGCLLVLLNFLLLIALITGRILQLLYFGQLRRSEVELVCERSWYSLVGTLLAVSIFRDDFSVSFVILFGVLLFLKIFHWLSAERVASIMQSPSVPRIFHARMVSMLTTLLIADLLLVGFSLQMLLVKKVKVGMMVLFTSEFIILTALLGNTIAQYVLNCIDMAREDQWEAKSLYVLYVDLAHDIVRLCTHGYFFVLLTRLYGIPLSLIHDLYSAGRSCTMKVKALVRYRQAVRKMETKYPNATATDLASTDGTCIICREDMVALSPNEGTAGPAVVTNVTPKKLSCGHIFHFRCLRSWLERQQSCPTCRRMILDDEAEVPPPAAPVAPPQQQLPAAPPADARANVPATLADEPGTNAQAFTAAEEAYDDRLQGFLSRLQSDLRKVREEGNASARQASSSRRQTASRSGRSTPRTAGAGGSNGGTGAFGSPRYGRMNGVLPSQAGGEEASAAGLWMPPPPSTLYPGGRRPAPTNGASHPTEPELQSDDADADTKGKGKARAEDDPSDPLDPKEAIRQATLRRFGPPTATTSSTAASSATPTSQAIGMIPLFDPTSIPDFAAHQASLPHSLLARPAGSGGRDASAVLDAHTRAVHHQIALLTGIQARIDGVIADLTNVLDVVGAGGLAQQGYTRSTQGTDASTGETNATSL